MVGKIMVKIRKTGVLSHGVFFGSTMDAKLTSFLIVVLLEFLLNCDAAVITNSTGCKNSFDCGSSMCCRDASGVVISDQDLGGFGPLRPIGSIVTGTCSSKKALKGEMCDSNCECDTGLLCYRPMSGVCCPPRLCYDEAYVKKQQAYWHNCMSNPSCALPP